MIGHVWHTKENMINKKKKKYYSEGLMDVSDNNDINKISYKWKIYFERTIDRNKWNGAIV